MMAYGADFDLVKFVTGRTHLFTEYARYLPEEYRDSPEYDENWVPLFKCTMCGWIEPETDRWDILYRHVMEHHGEYVKSMMVLAGVKEFSNE
jgi:hypothetical protein